MRCILWASLLMVCALFNATSYGSSQEGSANVHDVFNDDHLDDHDKHEEEEHKLIEKRIAEMAKADVYSCQLQRFSHQCREYRIPDDIKSKIPELTESCQTLPEGKFTADACPKVSRVGRCLHIVRNYHDPRTLIYDNHYYQGTNSRWTEQEMQRVCTDLEGKFLPN